MFHLANPEIVIYVYIQRTPPHFTLHISSENMSEPSLWLLRNNEIFQMICDGQSNPRTRERNRPDINHELT